MKQPAGTVTYKGHRKSLPGQDSLASSTAEQAAVSKAEAFHAEGKSAEKKALKEKETQEGKKRGRPAKSEPDQPELSEGNEE